MGRYCSFPEERGHVLTYSRGWLFLSEGGLDRPVSGGSFFPWEQGDLVLWVYVGLRTLRADMEKLLLTHVTCDGE
jgi:hypothetical protein